MSKWLTPIHALCPRADHVHCADTAEKAAKKLSEGFTPKMCIICNPEKNLINFHCKDFVYNSRFYLTRDAKITILCILNRKNTFHWLPTELHRFIMCYFKTPGNPLWIYNETTKKHYEKCKECAKNLVNFVDTHSCPHHIVIRKC